MHDQQKQDRKGIRAWIRDLWPLVAITVVCNLSGGSECFWSGSSNNKKIHQNNNPVIWVPGGQEIPADAMPYLLESYRIEAPRSAEEDGIPSLQDIRNVSLKLAGIEEVSPATLREFTARTLAVNQDLLGLPDHAGTLVFMGVATQGEHHLVMHGHVARDEQEILSPVPGSLLTFAFDADGRLLEIASTVHWPK